MSQSTQQRPAVRPSWQRISRGMVVRFRDGGIGTVEHLWIDTHHTGSAQMTVRLATPPPHEILVPLDQIYAIDDLGLEVDMDSVPVELLNAHL